MLTLEPTNIIITIINLLVLFLFMQKFLLGPVRNVMEERRKMIEESMEQAEKAKEDAEQMRKEYEDILSGAEHEADAIRAKGREQANVDYDERIAQANADIEKLHRDANAQIEATKEQARRQMQSEVAGLAMAAAVKVMGEQNNALQDEALYESFIQEMGEKRETTAG